MYSHEDMGKSFCERKGAASTIALSVFVNSIKSKINYPLTRLGLI